MKKLKPKHDIKREPSLRVHKAKRFYMKTNQIWLSNKPIKPFGQCEPRMGVPLYSYSSGSNKYIYIESHSDKAS